MGIGFHIADRVALELGIARDAPARRGAALLHALFEATKEGHTLQPAEALARRAAALVEETGSDVDWRGLLEDLRDAGEVVVDDELREGTPLVYLAPFHAAERGLARNLDALIAAGPVRALADEARLWELERNAGLELHPDQRAAVLGLLREPVALLTGGPGVGKTTIVRLVVELAEAASRARRPRVTDRARRQASGRGNGGARPARFTACWDGSRARDASSTTPARRSRPTSSSSTRSPCSTSSWHTIS